MKPDSEPSCNFWRMTDQCWASLFSSVKWEQGLPRGLLGGLAHNSSGDFSYYTERTQLGGPQGST